MKVFFTACCFFFVGITTAQWTWMKGPKTFFKYGVYGTKGVAATSNRPGTREDFMSWTDHDGNFWLFGGTGFANSADGWLNDLWKYEPATNQWTWVNGDSVINLEPVYGTKGIASPTNNPGMRLGSAGWCDASGNFWIYGGTAYRGTNQETFSDLWRYEPATNQWTWMNGEQAGFSPPHFGTQGISSALNTPGARALPSGWSDESGNLFLFGGYMQVGGAPSGNEYLMNELWMYSTSTNEWTWLTGSGTGTGNAPGIYGTRGMPAAANTPGSRAAASIYSDHHGNVWLFGGSGLDVQNNWGRMNDLWKYDPGSNQWIWISGDSLKGNFGNYGSKGIAAPTNKPGGRCWTNMGVTLSGNILVFGGFGLAASGDPNASTSLNDLWEYNRTTDQWTWLTGDSIQNGHGVYGTLGVPSANNSPCAKFIFGSGWTDLAGNFWIFGGQGTPTAGPGGDMADLWRYTPVSTVPVSLVSFTGNRDNEVVHLFWKVEDELNFDRYEVERSFDDRNYEKIGLIKTIHASQYHFDDHSTNIVGRTLFYRLRMVDIDAKYSYSKIVALNAAHNGIIAVSPTPASTYVRIQFSKNITGRIDASILDLGGRLVTKETYTVDEMGITVPTNQLANGTYVICISGNGNKYFARIVVTK